MLEDEDLLVGTNLEIVDKAAYEAAKKNKRMFILMRRNGFGASDSSTLCGVNPYNKIEKLINEKASMVVSMEELGISDLVNVRKGSDLEPLILDKFKEFTKIQDLDLFKPGAMYRIKETPLTVNFDGIFTLKNSLPYIPVEAKFVSSYAHKYWKFENAVTSIVVGSKMIASGIDMPDRIKNTAAAIGIPPYYYTQVQHQLFALEADFGFLAALDEKDWKLHVFKIFADDPVQKYLLSEANNAWDKVMAVRQKKQPL